MGFFFFSLFLNKATFRYQKAFCNSLTPSVPGGPESHTSSVSHGTWAEYVQLWF